MIEPHELRIGNFVEVENYKIIQLENIHPKGTTKGDEIYLSSMLKPIELSEHWLLKFGFDSNNVAYKIDNDRFIFELYFYDAWNLNYVEKSKFGNGSVELSGYWKIHELQNLFFALTGEELKIK
ncbi:hypothetical protein [Chryseobacterium sp. WX]|uniref:hypothetical protein n=1 Tax=Chryseobacterium sp. WX TaxID=3031803 RepID=UPI0024092007|nr:hypothetical protein [Chryseobacterium sp. WX]WFB67051.1 hypothetical protein PZ898_20405 [Chryseobacterium sp. WX]